MDVNDLNIASSGSVLSAGLRRLFSLALMLGTVLTATAQTDDRRPWEEVWEEVMIRICPCRSPAITERSGAVRPSESPGILIKPLFSFAVCLIC